MRWLPLFFMSMRSVFLIVNLILVLEVLGFSIPRDCVAASS